MMVRTLGRAVLKRYVCIWERRHMRWPCLHCGFINCDIKHNVKGQKSDSDYEWGVWMITFFCYLFTSKYNFF